MIEKENISFNYIQKEPLYGSFEGMRYCFMKKGDSLTAIAYPEPFCLVKTPENQKSSQTFPNTADGLIQAIEWLNGQYTAHYADHA